jgi:SPP1 gp7 family putative phage head morphogenesis protein
VSRAALFGAGADAAEALLRDVYRMERVAKGKKRDPLTHEDFPVISRRIGKSLHDESLDAEQQVYERALKKLDVNWEKLTPAQRAKAHREFKAALKDLEAKVLPRVDKVFKTEAKGLMEDTRRSAKKTYGLGIDAKPSEGHKKIEKFLHESQRGFVREELRGRVERDAQRAKRIVESGLENGLSRKEILKELSEGLTGNLKDRSKRYNQRLAMSFTNSGRTYAQLQAFEEGGIEEFEFRAVRDERTSEMCLFMHGHVFSVKSSMNRVRKLQTLRDPERIRDHQPWMQIAKDKEGNEFLYYKRGDRRQKVTNIERHTVENVGDATFHPGIRQDEDGNLLLASYPNAKHTGQLEGVGVTLPPLHAHCRSTIVPKTTDGQQLF